MFDGQKDKLALWSRCTFVDPKFTKTYKGKGGFTGRSTTATHIIQRATEEFGPAGIGWGWDVVDSYYIDGAPMIGDDGTNYGNEKLHVVRLSVWYVEDGVRSSGVTHFGQTTFVGMQKKSIWRDNKKIAEKEVPVSDEEHAKKSLTDALTKALSCIGFASDIHLGMWDDNKYVRQMEQQAEERSAPSHNGNGQHANDVPGDARQDRSARSKELEREAAIRMVRADIKAQRSYDAIGKAVAKGYALAAEYGDAALHDELKKLANDHWLAIKSNQKDAEWSVGATTTTESSVLKDAGGGTVPVSREGLAAWKESWQSALTSEHRDKAMEDAFSSACSDAQALFRKNQPVVDHIGSFKAWILTQSHSQHQQSGSASN